MFVRGVLHLESVVRVSSLICIKRENTMFCFLCFVCKHEVPCVVSEHLLCMIKSNHLLNNLNLLITRQTIICE